MCTYIFISLRCIPRGEIARSYGNHIFNILWSCQPVFQSCCIPTNNVGRFYFSPSLPTSIILLLKSFFYYSHPCGCKVTSHCGFDLHFLSD